jgi:NAD(P)-dependent dehydrogenase (short-subunit alcohol dehydrogenase family)
MGALDGKVAIVTGAGRGIGRGEAIGLAAEGASVIVNDLGGSWDGTGHDQRPAQQVVDEIVAAGGAAVANYDDIAEWDGGRRLIEQAIDTYGRLDILVCNAGIARDRTIFNMSESEWDDVIRVHLKGHFVPTHFATAHWRELAKSTGKPANGRIIFTSSGSGVYGNSGQANYGAAKAGIAALGIIVAREMERYGVTCNSICPRARTRLTESAHGAFASVSEDQFDEYHPDNAAPLIAFLASDAASDVSGQTFLIFGGRIELLCGWRVANSIELPRRWTLQEIVDSKDALFDGLFTGIPPMPEVKLPVSG